MTKFTLLIVASLAGASLTCAQQASPDNADAGGNPATAETKPAYTPQTHAEKFHTYLRHTYGIGSILEAGARAGIDQALDRPSEWPQGATGYAERFGSAIGLHAVRGTTAYAFGELFKEDLRYIHCAPDCSTANRFKAALENTFEARKGDDGHLAFSMARLLGPISGSLVASTWRPDGFRRSEIGREVGLTYGFGFMRNLVRELVRH